jgi:hypothetical protein
MSDLIRWVLVAILAAMAYTVAAPVHAETIPAQLQSSAEACGAVVSAYNASEQNGRVFSMCTANPCKLTCSGGAPGSCPTDGSCPWTVTVTPQYVCPAGYTMQGSGSTATCYKSDCQSGQSVGTLEWSGSSDTPVSLNGCRVDCSTSVSMGGEAAGTGCKLTGQDAQPSDLAASSGDTGSGGNPPAPSPGSCLAAGSGYITSSSGVTSCVDPADSPDTYKQVTKTDTPNGPRTETVECQGGECTVTRTDNEGTQSGTKSTFCEENPNASVCKDYGTPTDDVGLQGVSIGVENLPSVSINSNNSCPADMALPHGLSLSWEPICDGMSMFRPIVIAMALLSAALIVVGSVRGE